MLNTRQKLVMFSLVPVLTAKSCGPISGFIPKTGGAILRQEDMVKKTGGEAIERLASVGPITIKKDSQPVVESKINTQEPKNLEAAAEEEEEEEEESTIPILSDSSSSANNPDLECVDDTCKKTKKKKRSWKFWRKNKK